MRDEAMTAVQQKARRRFFVVLCDALIALARALRCWQIGDCPDGHSDNPMPPEIVDRR